MTEFTQLILKISPANKFPQKQWKLISDKAIKNKIVEPLTDAGLQQAIDTLAYQICQEAQWCTTSGLSDFECDQLLGPRMEVMDNILNTIALASGIHPDTIDFLVGIRTDNYTDILLSVLMNDE